MDKWTFDDALEYAKRLMEDNLCIMEYEGDYHVIRLVSDKATFDHYESQGYKEVAKVYLDVRLKCYDT